jgi:hypothetical protein
MEADVGGGEPVSGEPRLVDHAVEPAHAGARDLLLRLRLLGLASETRLEEVKRFGIVHVQLHPIVVRTVDQHLLQQSKAK